ncbi:MAG TPA: aspartate carbamoyltransferase [Candidatus Peribacteraceae bacterium]|nr:aspartate carbamoyltransferase [Candidatus Peribacteraceae bacterium]
MQLSFQHLTSTLQVSRKDADLLVKTALEMEKILKKGGDDRLHGKVLAALFYEPSTRTRLSFETAMQRLGGGVISAEGLQFSSMYKGETLEDTIKMVNQYADIIAMRHPESGSADRAAAVSTIPFINAGDGANQHPTQGLLDLLTIRKERGTTEGLHVAFCGDLKYGRTVQSLTYLMALYPDNRFTYISPVALKMPEKTLAFLKEKNIPYVETTSIEDGLDADVLYMTRVQKERFDDVNEYEKLKDSYILTAKHLTGKNVTVMHPLPRVNEISTDVDQLPNAAYFREAGNGVLMRMALLDLMLRVE